MSDAETYFNTKIFIIHENITLIKKIWRSILTNDTRLISFQDLFVVIVLYQPVNGFQ